MKTISIPANDRPHHLAQCLAALRACPQWREWRVVFSCEPPPRMDIQIVTATIPNAIISHNPVKLGCWHNTFHAATLAMSLGSTVNLYLEDDYLITPDTLTLVELWSATPHEGVLCLRRRDDDQDHGHPNVVSPRQSGLFGCGFAWRSSLWPIVRNAWFGHPYGMWDLAMEHVLAVQGIPQWRPVVNRAHGIGVVGTHCRTGMVDPHLFGPAYSGPPIAKFTFIP